MSTESRVQACNHLVEASLIRNFFRSISLVLTLPARPWIKLWGIPCPSTKCDVTKRDRVRRGVWASCRVSREGFIRFCYSFKSQTSAHLKPSKNVVIGAFDPLYSSLLLFFSSSLFLFLHMHVHCSTKVLYTYYSSIHSTGWNLHNIALALSEAFVSIK